MEEPPLPEIDGDQPALHHRRRYPLWYQSRLVVFALVRGVEGHRPASGGYLIVF